MSNFNYELFELIDKARLGGANVSYAMDIGALMREGRDIIESVQVHSGIPGIGPHSMSPLIAAEQIREAIASGRVEVPHQEHTGPVSTFNAINDRLSDGLIAVYDLIQSARRHDVVDVQAKADTFDRVATLLDGMLMPYLVEKRRDVKADIALAPELNEGVLAEFFARRIEDEWNESDVPARMVTFGLMDPVAFSLEMAERMDMAREDVADGGFQPGRPL